MAQAYNPLHVILLVDGPTSIDRTTVIHQRALLSVTVSLNQDWDASLEAASVNAQGLFTAGQLKLFARKINSRLDLAADTKELTVIQPDNPPVTVSSAELVGQTSAALLGAAPGRTLPRHKFAQNFARSRGVRRHWHGLARCPAPPGRGSPARPMTSTA